MAESLKEKRRKIQRCTFCKNHNLEIPKKGHQCPFKECSCALCNLQRKAQMTMRQQQRFWRHQKLKLRQASCGISSHYLENIYGEKGQLCDMCRNHNKLTLKKNHCCPFMNCGCQRCSLTFKRRELMKRLQRVRRSKMTSLTDVPNTSRTFWMSDILSYDPKFSADAFYSEDKVDKYSELASVEGPTNQNHKCDDCSGSAPDDSIDFYLKMRSKEFIMKYKTHSSVSVHRGSPPPLIPLVPYLPPSLKNYKSEYLIRPCESPPSLDPLSDENRDPPSAGIPVQNTFICSNLFHHSKSSQFRPKFSTSSASLSASYFEEFSQSNRERLLSFFFSNASYSNFLQ